MSNVKSFEEANGSSFGDILSNKRENKKIKIPYNPTVPLLGIFLAKAIIQKGTCTPMFIAAVFTIIKAWKQPKCPSTEEQVKKMWYVYTMEYYSAKKRMK